MAWGFDGVEFRRVSSAPKYENQEKYLDDLAAAKEKHGLKYVIFGYPTADLMQPDASKRERK